MSALTSFDLGATVFAALVAGLVADGIIDAFQPDAEHPLGYRLMAGLTPLALWSTYILVLTWIYGIVWPFDLWLGTTFLAAISGLLLSYVAIAPVVPAPVTEGGLPEVEDERRVPTGARVGEGATGFGGGGEHGEA